MLPILQDAQTYFAADRFKFAICLMGKYSFTATQSSTLRIVMRVVTVAQKLVSNE
jgi:hypothetical protein